MIKSIMPLGMECVKTTLEEIVEKSHIYKYCDISLPHFIIHLESGNGRTTLVEYITDTYIDHSLRRFSGKDTYLEYNLDGSMSQLEEIHVDLNARYSGYYDAYNGVVAIDIRALETKANEAHIDFFLKIIEEFKKSATFILFVPDTMNRTLEKLMNEIKCKLACFEELDIPKYTTLHLAEISVNSLYVKGIDVQDEDEVISTVTKIIDDNNNITTAKSAVELSDKLALCADFSNYKPIIKSEIIRKYCIGGKKHGK